MYLYVYGLDFRCAVGILHQCQSSFSFFEEFRCTAAQNMSEIWQTAT